MIIKIQKVGLLIWKRWSIYFQKARQISFQKVGKLKVEAQYITSSSTNNKTTELLVETSHLPQGRRNNSVLNT